MKTATIRDLRTRFPEIRRLLEEEGEILITDHGKPIVVLRPYRERRNARPRAVDYYARLTARMPRTLTAAQREELDEANRGER
jgi:prevent-host-death family protein